MPAEYFDDVTPQYTLQQIFSEVEAALDPAGEMYYGWANDVDLWTKSEQPDEDESVYDGNGNRYPLNQYRVQSYNSIYDYIMVTVNDGSTAPMESYREDGLDYEINAPVYAIDDELVEKWETEHTGITGYAPEQTARERLQWILFITGAYIKSFFNEIVEIKKIPEATIPIPNNKVFWRPSIKYSDYVTAVIVTAYTYTPTSSDPRTTDKWVQDEYGHVYIQSEHEVKLTNPDVPVTAPPKEIKVNDLTLINNTNVSEIASRMALYYFKRVEMDASVIDCGEYLPGDKCIIASVGDAIVTGFINSASFVFGHKQGAKLHLTQSDVSLAVKLIIIYTDHGEEVQRAEYYLPAGYNFSIENPYPKIKDGNRFTVYFPINDYAEGIMGETETVIYEPVHIALQKVKKRLYIFDVDALSNNEDELRID
jgi:hypothetical protein